MNEKDRIYDSMISEPGDFVFDERVVRVFPDMINRSVPGYGTIVPMTGMLARKYARAGTRLYDLGCSLGAVSLAMSRAVQAPETQIVAVDRSTGMIEGLKRALSRDGGAGVPIQPVQQDILSMEIDNASVVVLNFTLQFVKPEKRAVLLARIFEGLVDGGVLILSEKIAFTDPGEQVLQTDWHHEFKRAQGYSDLEIARKRDALEDVLIPESLEKHVGRLRAAGFGAVYQWFQGFSFVSLAAFRKNLA